MRVAYNDSDDGAGLRGYVQFNKYTYIHTYLRSVAKMGTGTKGTGTRVGSGMAKKRLRSARNR